MPEWKLTPRMESPTKPPIKNNHEIKKDEEINNKYDSASAKLRYSIIASSAGLILAFYGLMEKELSLVFSGLSFYSLGRMGETSAQEEIFKGHLSELERKLTEKNENW